MAQSRRKRRVEPKDPAKGPAKREDAQAQESLGAIPELMRRAITLGLTGFFTTEEAVRRALGDTVPKDWTDYIAESSDRTRSEFLDRLSREIARTLKDIDLAAVLVHTDEQEQADLLLERAEVYIDGVSEEQRRNQFRTAPMDIYALQGRADDAFEAMEQAFEDGWRSGWWRLEHKPHFDSIRDDPRFDEMVERLRAATSG